MSDTRASRYSRRSALRTFGLAGTALLIAACSSSFSQPNQPTAPTTPAGAAPAGAPASAAAGCTIQGVDKATTVSYLGNKFPIIEYFANQLKTCEGGNLKVNVDWLPANERDQKANLILASGDTSYEIIQATDRNLYEWSAKGWLRPLDDLIAKYRDQYALGDIPDAVWDGIRVDGKVYGFPIDQNAQIFFYRKDIWDKYSLKPPATWDEALIQFKTLAEKKDTTVPYSATYAKGSDLAGEFTRFLISGGGTWFGAGGKAAFNDAKGVAAAKLIKDTMPYMAPDILTYNNDKVMIALQQSEAASAITYISRTAQMDDAAQSKVVGKIDYAAVPAVTPNGPSGTAVQRDNYVIPAKTKVDPDLIFRVIVEATTAQRDKGAADLGMVPRTSVAKDPEIVKNHRYLPAVVDALGRKEQFAFPKEAYYSLALIAVGNALPEALTGSVSIEDALNQAAQDYESQARDKGFIQ